METNEIYDLIIVGAGPAGLTAALYATRAMLNAITIEQLGVGGQVLTTTDIDNYPGVPNTDGFTLSNLMKTQVSDLGGKFISDQVETIERDEETGIFTVGCTGNTYQSRTVIVATGATPRRAGFENEERFTGHGVSYCGTCDGMFYRGKNVYVVGGGNSAGEEALFLANLADHVTIVVRKDHMRAQAAMQEKLAANPKIDIKYMTSITKVDGNEGLSEISFRNNETGEITTETYPEGSFGVFVFVGHIPVTDTLGDMVEYSASKSVITDVHMATKTPGLFVAGDVRECPIRQIITAAADGAIAATSSAEFLGQPLEY